VERSWCILDADDTFYPPKLGAVVDAFRQNEWGLLVHPLMVVDSDAESIQRKPAFTNFEKGWIADDVARRGARWAYMEASAVCLRQSVARLVFPIPENDFRSWADAYVCTMAALVAPVGYVDRTLATYRLHEANVSGFSSLDANHGCRAQGHPLNFACHVRTRRSRYSLSPTKPASSRRLTTSPFSETCRHDVFGSIREERNLAVADRPDGGSDVPVLTDIHNAATVGNRLGESSSGGIRGSGCRASTAWPKDDRVPVPKDERQADRRSQQLLSAG
jgi:hypothetical protein